MSEEAPSESPTPDDQPREADRDAVVTPPQGRGRGFFGRFRRGRSQPPLEDETALTGAFELTPEAELRPARPAPSDARNTDDVAQDDTAGHEDASSDEGAESSPALEVPAAPPGDLDALEEPPVATGPEQDEAGGNAAPQALALDEVEDEWPLEAADDPAADDALDDETDDEPGEPLPAGAAQVAEEPRVRQRRAGISAHLVILTALATIVVMAFLLIEPSPRWVLLLGAGAVVIGLDGTLRHTWRLPFSAGAETAPFLFVPALYMLAVPVLIEHNVPGELVLPVGLLAGLGFGALAWAETASVRAMARDYDLGRVLVTAGTYLAGFAVFSLTYVFDVNLSTAILAVGLASTMLAVEVLREGEIDPQETLGFAVVTGVIMAEARLLLYYVPLETYLAGLTLLLAFYLATGLLHSHVTRAFSWAISVEYGGIAAAGLGLVVAARVAGLA